MSAVVREKERRIYSSHLALRFYKGWGWTKELLEPYLTRGQMIDQIEGQDVRDYWFLDHTKNSCLDMERLFKELKPRVYHWNGNKELFDQEAIEYLEKMNW